VSLKALLPLSEFVCVICPELTRVRDEPPRVRFK
jgi:hypothetical protein